MPLQLYLAVDCFPLDQMVETSINRQVQDFVTDILLLFRTLSVPVAASRAGEWNSEAIALPCKEKHRK